MKIDGGVYLCSCVGMNQNGSHRRPRRNNQQCGRDDQRGYGSKPMEW
jgi:hypothetical protein